MKHIIIYENFQSRTLFETKSMPSGAILISNDEEATIKPGNLYVTLSKDDESKEVCNISYIKSDRSKKVDLYFTNNEEFETTLANGKLVKGVRIYVSSTPLQENDLDKPKGISGAWTEANEANCMAALDSFLASCGAYLNPDTGKVFGKTLALTILEIIEKDKEISPNTLKSMSAVITNAAKLNKPIISGTTDAQKGVNTAILAAVKNKISPKKV